MTGRFNGTFWTSNVSERRRADNRGLVHHVRAGNSSWNGSCFGGVAVSEIASAEIFYLTTHSEYGMVNHVRAKRKEVNAQFMTTNRQPTL